MATLIILPKQGQSVESCIITEIQKRKGEEVQKGDVLFSYETDKASFEEESSVDGIVLEVFYNEGDEVEVLKPMMIIGEEGEDYADLLAEISVEKDALLAEQNQDMISSGSAQGVEVEAQEISMKTETEIPNRDGRAISPRAKSLAQKEAVDITRIMGTGPQGRIIEQDIQAYLNRHPKLTGLAKKLIADDNKLAVGKGTGLAGTVRAQDLGKMSEFLEGDFVDVKLSNMRKIIAKAMYESLQNSAQLTHHLGADARSILALRKSFKKKYQAGELDVNITLNDMICFAVIKTLKKFENVNSHFLGDSMRLFNKVHLGLAVDTERGLMVPVARNADDMSLAELAKHLKELATSCKVGTISPDLLSSEAATFTVSNLGNYGVEMFTPVINLPQSAILGVNTIVPRPKDLGDGVYGFIPYLGLSLTYDHRALDGGEATRFLKGIAEEVEMLSVER